jgi:hypothetical protein
LIRRFPLMSLSVTVTAISGKHRVSCHFSLSFRLMWKFIFLEQEAFSWINTRLLCAMRPFLFFTTQQS